MKCIETETGIMWVDENLKPHNDAGPAIVNNDGRKEWWIHGKRHNTNGPAVITKHGLYRWYINGERYNQQRYSQYIIEKRISQQGNK